MDFQPWNKTIFIKYSATFSLVFFRGRSVMRKILMFFAQYHTVFIILSSMFVQKRNDMPIGTRIFLFLAYKVCFSASALAKSNCRSCSGKRCANKRSVHIPFPDFIAFYREKGCCLTCVKRQPQIIFSYSGLYSRLPRGARSPLAVGEVRNSYRRTTHGNALLAQGSNAHPGGCVIHIQRSGSAVLHAFKEGTQH